MGFLAELLTYWTINAKIRREEIGDNIKDGFNELVEGISANAAESRAQASLTNRIEFAADEMDYLGLKYAIKYSEYNLDSHSGLIKLHFFGKPDNPHMYVTISCTGYDQNNIPIYKNNKGVYLNEEFREIEFNIHSVDAIPYKLIVRAEWNGKKDWLKIKEAEKEAEKENVPKEHTVDEPPVIKEKPGIIVLLTFLISVVRVAIGCCAIIIGNVSYAQKNAIASLIFVLFGLSLFPVWYMKVKRKPILIQFLIPAMLLILTIAMLID